MARHKRRAEARRESCFRLRQPALRTANDRGIAGQEMIHRLIGGEATDRRHNAKRIRGQHDNVLRLSTNAAHFHIRNERQGIGCPGVLGQRFVVEV